MNQIESVERFLELKKQEFIGMHKDDILYQIAMFIRSLEDVKDIYVTSLTEVFSENLGQEKKEKLEEYLHEFLKSNFLCDCQTFGEFLEKKDSTFFEFWKNDCSEKNLSQERENVIAAIKDFIKQLSIVQTFYFTTLLDTTLDPQSPNYEKLRGYLAEYIATKKSKDDFETFLQERRDVKCLREWEAND